MQGEADLLAIGRFNSGIARWVQIENALKLYPVRSVFDICAQTAPEDHVKRYAILYLATLIVIIPIDFLFLGTIAKSFFTSQVGDMLGDIRLAPAILFYLLFVAGILIFVSGPATATWQSTLLYGALFGLFCYGTFELTALSLLRHWTWPVVLVDVCWGTFVTAVSATIGLMLVNLIAPEI
jgi:uncharacterized membrane protein